MKAHGMIYTLRGWIAFVAFMDLGTAVRCFLDDNFLGNKVYTAETLSHSVNPVMARLFGIWSVLNAVILLHCAVCIHYRPVVAMAVCSIVLSILNYLSETFIYQTTPFGFSVFFPIGVCLITLVWLGIAAPYIWPVEDMNEVEENGHLKKNFNSRKNWNKKRR